jgi:filamentous hemagglutinin
VGLAGARHPSGVVFDQRGFPIFDDVAAFDTKLPTSVTGVNSRPLHFQEAARALSDAIRRGQAFPYAVDCPDSHPAPLHV